MRFTGFDQGSRETTVVARWRKSNPHGTDWYVVEYATNEHLRQFGPFLNERAADALIAERRAAYERTIADRLGIGAPVVTATEGKE